jgi:hypothetical protein
LVLWKRTCARERWNSASETGALHTFDLAAKSMSAKRLKGDVEMSLFVTNIVKFVWGFRPPAGGFRHKNGTENLFFGKEHGFLASFLVRLQEKGRTTP